MNINDLKARLAGLNRRTAKANDVWKPKDEHDVRLMPYPFAPDPLNELYFHYEIGETTSILCPKANFGKDCEICDFCDKLKSWQDASGQDKPESTRRADFEIFKKVQPKARVFIPMVERGKEGDGAKFWGVTPAQATQILEICAETDRLDELGLNESNALDAIFSTKKAYDLHVSFAKKGEKGNQKTYAQVTIKPKLKTSPLMGDKEQTANLLASVKNLKDVYPEVPSEEVSRMLQKFLGSGAAEAKPEGGTEKYAANTKESSKVVGGKSIDEAFGDLLSDGK